MSLITPRTSERRLLVPEPLRIWSCGIAEINSDISDEGLFVKGGYPLGPTRQGNLYGGYAPVPPHVDVTEAELDGRPAHPVWGLMLACPEGSLEWDGGSTAIGTGSAYVVDPTRRHAVSGSAGCVAFIATWDWNPEEAFEDLDAFADAALALAIALHARNQDPASFLESELGMIGELC